MNQDILTDKFPTMISDFLSYENKQDITSTFPNILQPGSQNMFIVKLQGSKRPSKLTTRAGMELLGSTGLFNIGIRSSFDKLFDKLGNQLLIREFPKGGAERDIIEVYLHDDNQWHKITETTNPLPLGSHKYRFSEWWDVANAQSRLIMVNGNYDTVTRTSKVLSWTGGYAQVVGVGTNTLSLGPFETWEGHGFIQNSPNFLVFNGQQFVIVSGWATNTLTLATDPTGIIFPSNYVFQGIRADTLVGQSGATITGFTMDTITNYLNHIVYGDFNNATVYFSHIEDEDAETTPIIEGFNFGINDLNFFKGNPYTAPDNNTYKIQITSSTYVAIEGFATANSLNDTTWNFAGYTDPVAANIHGYYAIITTPGTYPVADQVDIYEDGVFIAGYSIIAGSPIFFPTTNVSITFASANGHSTGDSWTYTYGGVDKVTTYKNDVVVLSGVAITGTSQTISDGIVYEFATVRGHNIGDNWSIDAFPAVVDAWKNVSFSQPVRLPGEGTFLVLDAPVIDMLPQEDGIYFNTRSGSWIRSTFTLSADLQSEFINTQKLKSQYQNKMLENGLINYDLNSIIYITEDKTVLSLGRLELLQEPQNKNISDPVKYDFQFADLTDGDVKLWGTYQLFTAPREGKMYVFDHALGIWQPPQIFADPIGKLSVYGSQIVGHSYTKNMSYTLFTGTNDNGAAFTTRVVLPYNVYWGRDMTKMYSMTWAEGYMFGAPQINFTVNRGLLGCLGSESHIINPIMCVPPDTASLGAGSYGLHSLGSDEIQIPPKFREIWKDSADGMNFYEANMQLECSTLDQDWQLVSIGINVIESNNNNDDLVSNPPLSI